jgi:Uma2 family endonuclease
MELLVETVAETELSDYEIERNKPMPSTNHAFIQDNLVFELNVRYRKDYKILPEVSLDTPDKGSVPDLAIYPKFELDIRHDIIKRTDPPLVTIEILSPQQNLQDLIDKTYRYFEFGVKSCWIVLPSLRTIIVYSAADTFEYVKGDVVLKDPNTGLELELKKVFE